MLDVRDNLRDDERRKREEARLTALQEQIDELRSLLRESTSRQGQLDEGQLALGEQIQAVGELITAVQSEARGQGNLREVEIARLRDTVGQQHQHFTESLTALPNLQAQITDLNSHIRNRFQELGEDRHRFSELQSQIDHLPPQIERSAEIARAVREEMVGLRAEIDVLRGENRRSGDMVGMVEQEIRRRLVEFDERVTATNARLDALKEDLPPIDAQIDQLRREVQGLVPRFEQVHGTTTDLREELERITALSFDHHARSIALADESRLANEDRLRMVERLNDTRFASTMSRFNELEAVDQSLGHRLALLAVRLDELRDEDEATRLEVRRLEELRLRVKVEQAQQELQIFTTRLAELEGNSSDDDDEL